jgi:hypothetical protein
MRKKTLFIMLIFVIIIAVIIVAVLATEVARQREEKEVMMKEIERNYRIQNEILCTGYAGFNQYAYAPHYEGMERYLQLNLCAYNHLTDHQVTLEDVKTFLAEPLNPDGTPRTYIDDESGIIKNLVSWCYSNTAKLNGYRDDMESILSTYIAIHPGLGGVTLIDLNLEQINKLEKKLKDPTYNLDLGEVPTIL